MAAKRLRGDECDDDDHDQKKLKRMRTRHSFASVIREVVVKNFFDNMCSTLEPLIRKVVSEEVENRLRSRGLDWVPRCPSTLGRLDQIASNDREYQNPMNLKLRFAERLSLPIFTGTKIVDIHNNPLQIILDGGHDHHHHHQYPPPYSSIKVEILVLDGEFPGADHNDTWTKDEFARCIVRERTGKRPLIAGQSKVSLCDGIGVVRDIEFTDNSSWIRSRRFMLGARVVQIQGGNSSENLMFRIREAVTQPFVVKDHRGELYKKHHPPALEDDVWRLEKIGKGGTFHQKLASEGIHTVQDFLKLFTVDSSKIRAIMGTSDKIWESTLNHAKTCVMGTKLYRCHGDNYILTINPICEVIKIEIDGRIYSDSDLKRMQGASYIQSLVKDAYTKWNCLVEFDSHIQSHNTTQLVLTHKGEMEGDSYNCSHGQMSIMCYGVGVDTMSNINEEGECSEWALNSGFYISHGGH